MGLIISATVLVFSLFLHTSHSGEESDESRKFLFYNYSKSDGVTYRDIPPFWVQTIDKNTDRVEENILYPLYTRNTFGQESRYQIFQLLSWTMTAPREPVGEGEAWKPSVGMTFFPFFFSKQPSSTTEGYWAVFPFYGALENRLFKDRIEFTLFPAYARTMKKGVETHNILYPFFHKRSGPHTTGWGIWPLYGRDDSQPHEIINSWNDPEEVLGVSSGVYLWPLGHWRTVSSLEKTISSERAFLPFYRTLRSEERDSTTIGWPFFTYTNDRKQQYKEWALPWPLVVFSRGEGKTLNRVWPFYSYGEMGAARSGFLLWPLYMQRVIDSPPLYRQRDRILFFLYSDTKVQNTETQTESRRRFSWPLWHSYRDHQGNSEFGTLALMEPLFPVDEELGRTWSPLWTLFKTRSNREEKSREWSTFLNLAYGKTSGNSGEWSFGYGMLSRIHDRESSTWKLFSLPIFKSSRELQQSE